MLIIRAAVLLSPTLTPLLNCIYQVLMHHNNHQSFGSFYLKTCIGIEILFVAQCIYLEQSDTRITKKHAVIL
jgi:hypothetical protein